MKHILAMACLMLVLAACSKDNKPVFEEEVKEPVAFAKGADLSWVTEMESAGRKFYSRAGAEMECMALMKSLGMNAIRLRVWVNPSPLWCDVNDVVAKAVRAKNLGMRLLIDFHYSDFWADPGKQTKPAAWAGLNADGLKAAVSNHTTQVLTALKNAGVTPEWVQVGNETNNGMLWPEGQASAGGAVNYAQFVNAGYDAAKAVFPKTKVMVHVSNGHDNALFSWNIGGLISNGARFDVIGMSLYPSPANWSQHNDACLANMNDMVTKYNREVMVVEVGMSWDQAAVAKQFLTDLITKVKSVKDNKGIGVMYWEPQSYANWKGYTLGAFDNSGKPTEAMDAFAN